LNAHIGKCPGFCCLKTTPAAAQKKEYARNIRAIEDLLTGKRNTVIRRFAKTDVEIAMKLFRVFQNAQINSRNQSLIKNVNAPTRVEGYDIAHIGGEHVIGAMVVFTNGYPDKSQYRLFNIKTSGGDTDMLREMLERRFRHAPPAGGWQLPDLIVVDGGKAQLNVAKKYSGKIHVAAVTKDEHHRATKVIGAKVDQSLAFAVDAEAHRFAISRYRLLHRKALRGWR
jgi:excinuclease ABC subunit C